MGSIYTKFKILKINIHNFFLDISISNLQKKKITIFSLNCFSYFVVIKKIVKMSYGLETLNQILKRPVENHLDSNKIKKMLEITPLCEA